MSQLAEQHFPPLFPLLALGDVARAFEREAAAVHRLEHDAAFDDQFAPAFGLLPELAAPASRLEQLGAYFGERGSRHCRAEELIFLLSQRLLAAVAIKLLAAPVPFDDAVVEIPDENGIARKLHQPLVLPQQVLALHQRLLHLASFRDVHEGDDHAVDLVVHGPVWAQADVIPAIAAAANLAPDRSE